MARISSAKVQQLVSAELEAAVAAATGTLASAHVGEPNPLGGVSARASIGLKWHKAQRGADEPDYGDVEALFTLEVNPEQASEFAVYTLIDTIMDELHRETLRDAAGVHHVNFTEAEFAPPTSRLDEERGLVVVELRVSGDVTRFSGTAHDDHLD
jgi:hypothetical protein